MGRKGRNERRKAERMKKYDTGRNRESYGK